MRLWERGCLTDEYRNFFIFITIDFRSFISQTLKVVGLLGRKFDFFVPMGSQIDLFGVTFWMPELASHSFHLFY